jgi:hypothetical protein
MAMAMARVRVVLAEPVTPQALIATDLATPLPIRNADSKTVKRIFGECTTC